ncbi:MAG: protease modulator HflC [Chitinivibrionales bacterium]|nr:protease modulator HflC [Chitinivibrionales bacterium]MBD3356246.1 protease modulator HflC [Chitinivibrionales bacterium]
MKKIVGLIIVAAVLFVLTDTFYAVDETQQVVITQFGESVGDPITSPGLHLKAPFVHTVHTFAKNILEWDGQRGQVPTKDKTFIWVDVFGRWKITDALTFFEKVGDENAAQRRLDDIVDAAVRNVVTSHHLIEAVRTSERDLPIAEDMITDSSVLDSVKGEQRLHLELGRAGMREAILGQAQPKLNNLGIELVDVRFKRINYVDDVLRNVYDRMIAERRQIAEKYRSEGRGESQKILGRKERELKKIYSEAYRRSQIVKGEADAKATHTYAQAFNRDPEFYSFVQSLDLYKSALDSTTWAMFSTDADFLKYLKDYGVAR